MYFVVGVVGTVCECVMCGWVVHGHVWSVSYVPHAESGLRVVMWRGVYGGIGCDVHCALYGVC